LAIAETNYFAQNVVKLYKYIRFIVQKVEIRQTMHDKHCSTNFSRQISANFEQIQPTNILAADFYLKNAIFLIRWPNFRPVGNPAQKNS
jgi:hypothetical protein